VFVEIGRHRCVDVPAGRHGRRSPAIELDRWRRAWPRACLATSLSTGDFLKMDWLPFLSGLDPAAGPATAASLPRVGNLL
jgi:hypothetical protein